MAALPLQNLTSQSTTLQREYRTDTYDLGDGISYRIQDGINSNRWYGNIVYTLLNPTNYATVMNFLEGIGGWGTFDYTPNSNDSTSTCKFALTDKVAVQDAGGGYMSVTLPCRQEWV
jgi:phage-related protein